MTSKWKNAKITRCNFKAVSYNCLTCKGVTKKWCSDMGERHEREREFNGRDKHTGSWRTSINNKLPFNEACIHGICLIHDLLKLLQSEPLTIALPVPILLRCMPHLNDSHGICWKIETRSHKELDVFVSNATECVDLPDKHIKMFL